MPFEKDVILPYHELESPLPKNALCQVCLTLEHLVPEKEILFLLKLVRKFCFIAVISPLKSLKKNLRHEMIFCTKLAEIGPVDLKKKISKNCQHIFTMSLQSFESLISCLSFTLLWYVIISTFYDMVFV